MRKRQQEASTSLDQLPQARRRCTQYKYRSCKQPMSCMCIASYSVNSHCLLLFIIYNGDWPHSILRKECTGSDPTRRMDTTEEGRSCSTESCTWPAAAAIVTITTKMSFVHGPLSCFMCVHTFVSFQWYAQRQLRG